jgi:hypothetical protein
MAKKKNPFTLGLDEDPIVKAMAEPDSDNMGGEDDEDEDDDDEDEDDEDEDEDEDEDDEDGAMSAEKSMPSENDLVKAMTDLENASAALESGGSLRQADLAAKLANGETLSKSEASELRSFLDDDTESNDMRKSHREEFLEDAQIANGVEISGFLDAQVSALTKSLDDLRESISEGNGENRALVGKLAKGMHAIGMSNVALNRRVRQLEALVKSYGEGAAMTPMAAKAATRVGQRFEENRGIAGQPALIKSNGGNAATLSQTQIGSTITDLIKSTAAAGAKGFGVVDGVDLVHEQAKFEQTRQISPNAMRLVMRKNGIDPASVGL